MKALTNSIIGTIGSIASFSWNEAAGIIVSMLTAIYITLQIEKLIYEWRKRK